MACIGIGDGRPSRGSGGGVFLPGVGACVAVGKRGV